MKIFIHIYGSFVDEIFSDRSIFQDSNIYRDDIRAILTYGSASQLGIDPLKIGKNFFVCFTNSKYLQKKWANENNVEFDTEWRRKITEKQIEKFKPEVIFTLSPGWVLANFDLFKDIHLKSFWKASPVSKTKDYSKFDLGLTYHENYSKIIKEAGCPKVELHHFGFDPDVYNRLSSTNKTIDLSFVGTYNNQFNKRNYLLKVISKSNILSFKRIDYHLRIRKGWRIKGLFPNIPPSIYIRYKQPVYLRQMLYKLKSSKIVFNCHSDLAGNGKGNMRIFEAFATKSLLISDDGDYPPNIEDGKNFISYKNEKDLLDKIKYFWKNNSEREDIAENGYKILKKHYSIDSRREHLLSIFKEYL